jgi:hypothetical protein
MKIFQEYFPKSSELKGHQWFLLAGLHPKSLFLLPINVATTIKSVNVEMVAKTLFFNTINVAFGSKELLFQA